MTTDTATLPGVEEAEAKDLPPNPRDAFIDAIAARVAAEREEELKASAPVVEPDPAPAEEPTPQEEPESMEEESPAPEPAAVEPEYITIKVDGESRQVPKDKVMDAGMRALQKESAADKRLEEATRLLKEIEQKFSQQPQQPEPPPSQSWDEATIAYALGHGDEAHKVEAIRQIKGREQATPEQIAAYAAQQATREALDTMDFNQSAEWFQAEYKDIAGDPYLFQLAAVKEFQMRQGGDKRSRREVYREIGDELRKWKGGSIAAPTLEEKKERKATITQLPSASVRKAAPETPKEPTTSDIIKQMAKARGQAA